MNDETMKAVQTLAFLCRTETKRLDDETHYVRCSIKVRNPIGVTFR